MARKDIFTMSRKELQRLEIIRRELNEKISQVEASGYLKLSIRQMNRIVIKIVPGLTNLTYFPDYIKG